MYLDWYYLIGAIHWIVCVKFADSFERDFGCGKKLGRIIKGRNMFQSKRTQPEVPAYSADIQDISQGQAHKDTNNPITQQGVINYLLFRNYQRDRLRNTKSAAMTSNTPSLKQQSRRKRAFGNPSLPRKKKRRKKPPSDPQKKGA